MGIKEGIKMWKDSETELDFLDFDYLIEILKDIIEDESLLSSSIVSVKPPPHSCSYLNMR